mgnify:CR=1 FL=1
MRGQTHTMITGKRMIPLYRPKSILSSQLQEDHQVVTVPQTMEEATQIRVKGRRRRVDVVH